jgi:TM2 domain-containing membrane protein YozV
MKYCSNCGKKLKEGQDVCLNCGKVVSDSVELKKEDGEVGDKSKIAAGLLAIFFGCFGVHNFYLGYTGKAAGQLLLTILSLFLLSWVTAIWAFIEAILLFTGGIDKDGTGKLLKD